MKSLLLMRYLLVIISSCFLFSCSDAFINHKLKFEKAGDCTDSPKPVTMTANSNGERYEFLICLGEDFNGKDYTIKRKGDSLIVNFPKAASKKQLLYNIILDIDAKPNYQHINIEGSDITIVRSER